jgi:aspartyl protease family protein
MTSGQIAGLMFSLLSMVLVLSSLMSRKLSFGQTAKYALAWVGIFAIAIVLFSFRYQAGQVLQQVKRQFTAEEPMQVGKAVHILRGEDGHFNVNAQVNGRSVRFLVDTGATTSTMSRSGAEAAGVEVSDSGFSVAVDTANGMAMMRRGRIAELKIGDIQRNDMAILVSDDVEDLNLLGMNFLSSLSSWRVEGRELILSP